MSHHGRRYILGPFALPLPLLLLLALLLAGSARTAAHPTAQPAATTPQTPSASGARFAAGIGLTQTPICGLGWSVVSSPNPSSTDSTLWKASVISSNDVWAVGVYASPSIARTLAVHWDGAQWTYVVSPNRGSDTSNNYLFNVAGVSSTDAWAVGFNDTNGGGPRKTLTEHWDGTQWSIVPSADYITTTNELYAVSAISSNDVWAVGYYLEARGTFGYRRTLAEHWNGSQWSIVTSQHASSENNELLGVSAISSNDVWAVGDYLTTTGATLTLIEHWDGSVWSIISSPNPSNTSVLHSVSAISSNDVWAVGDDGTTLTEHWDGQQWTIVPSPNLGPNIDELLDVSAISTNDVWAVGYYCCDSGSPSVTLALHWDGTQWSISSSLNPANYINNFWGVAALSTGDVWAVGYMTNCGSTGCPDQTLIEHYSTVCVTATPSATISSTPTITSTPTGTPTSPPTRTPTSTTTPCPMTFRDVQPSDYFYQAVRYLYCAGVISGYSDGTFRPYNNTTRGQLTKIIVLAEGWTLDCPTPHFSDVPPSHTFYCFIETAYSHHVISGYSDGTFRPGSDVTRAQLCKIIVLAQGWADACPPPGHFTDVPPTDPFFCFIETAHAHNIISGYADNTFRPANPATRGQISKITYAAITPP